MTDMSAAFILVAILHGGPDDPFSMTQLAIFAEEAKCQQAASVVSATLKEGVSVPEIACLPLSAFAGLQRH